ncbi:nucleolar ribonucleoprotein [Cryptosporidium ubiquitum]|uniref:Nucleolar ribonucleoprotein n=1 Tax=Cryptosporidium ubiquitum TaxID=857276 RepID=A0A1J4MKG2_9CRYT|nr:nucleolar ribonucleoprotein [Cryptosporidium ubiquitum]OII74754.1 nucleolar ribonucleoprotein [Cryptosporidium ubiquitum]
MAVQTRNKKKDKTLWIPVEEEVDDSTSNDELEVMKIDDDYDSPDDSETEDQYEEEVEEGDSEEESNTKDWGNKKQDFYDGGSSSTDSEGENWSDVEMQDEEARGIQASRMMRLSREDFGMDDIIDQGRFEEEDESGENEANSFGLLIDDAETLLDSLSNLSNTRQETKSDVSIALEKEGLDGIESLNSELAPLLANVKEKVTEVEERMQVLLDLVKTKEGSGLVTEKGMEYLDSKNTLLLMYIGYLCYYMMLKTSPNVNIKEHPILLRLVTLRTMMEKLKPIDIRLQPQIDRILELAEKSSQVDNFLSSTPRPDRFIFEDEDNDNSDIEGDETSRHGIEDEFDESTNVDSDAEATEDSDSGNGIYKVPKNIPVEFNDKKLSKTEKMMRELERERKRLLRTDIIRQMRSSIHEGPEEVGKEDTEQLPQLERLQREIKERIDFEEDNMMRLPKTKKDKKEEKLYKRLMNQVEGGVNTLDDLAQFAERATDMATNSKKNSLTKYLTNASRLNKEITRSNLAQQNSDKSITEKLVKRRKAQAELSQKSKYKPEYDSDNINFERQMDESYAEAEEELFKNNSYLQDVAKFNEEKKMQKQRRKQEIDSRNMPNIDDLIDSGSRRASTKEMIKNKGLTRKRKKIEGNARVHNRLKYKKALKKLKGAQRSMRDYENSYSGESTGLKDNVKRSTNLN